MQRLTTKKFIGGDAHWPVNKAVSAYLEDPLAALFLMELVDKEDYFVSLGQAIKRKGRLWFFYTVEDMQARLFLGYKVQAKIIKKLKAAGLINSARYDNPAKRYFTVYHEVILRICLGLEDATPLDSTVLPNGQILFYLKGNSSSADSEEQVLPNGQNISNIEVSNTDLSNTTNPGNGPGSQSSPKPDPKKKKGGSEKLDGLVIDEAFQNCLDAFHERHKAYHLKLVETEEDYIPIPWSMKKERGNLNRIAKEIRKLAAAKAKKTDPAVKAKNISAKIIAEYLVAILLRVENFEDKFIAENHYTPSGIYSQWSKILNTIQKARENGTGNHSTTAANGNGNPGRGNGRKGVKGGAIVNEADLLGSVGGTRSRRRL